MMQRPIAGGLEAIAHGGGVGEGRSRNGWRTYPWGDEHHHRACQLRKTHTRRVYDERLAPVESYEAGNSPYGLHHMAGNVYEWTADWFDEDFYAKNPQRNPTGPSSGQYRMLRGGSWLFKTDRRALRTPELYHTDESIRLHRIPLCPGQSEIICTLLPFL